MHERGEWPKLPPPRWKTTRTTGSTGTGKHWRVNPRLPIFRNGPNAEDRRVAVQPHRDGTPIAGPARRCRVQRGGLTRGVTDCSTLRRRLTPSPGPGQPLHVQQRNPGDAAERLAVSQILPEHRPTNAPSRITLCGSAGTGRATRSARCRRNRSVTCGDSYQGGRGARLRPPAPRGPCGARCNPESTH